MIVGDPNYFAIESLMSVAYSRASFRALGYFNIHLLGERYGVHKADATLLGNSLAAVQERLDNEGHHKAGELAGLTGVECAKLYRWAMYGADAPPGSQNIRDRSSIADVFAADRVCWAPDGDAAFDDGSFVLQYDTGNSVRVIAFKVDEAGAVSESTVRDMLIEASSFYSVLRKWSSAFLLEWSRASKIGDNDGS